MLNKKIIMLENLPFNSYVRVGSHHYADLFSREFKLLWISLPFHIFQLLKFGSKDRVKSWNFNRPIKIREHFYAFTPFILFPYRKKSLFTSKWYINNMYYFIPGIKKIIKHLGFKDADILWFTDPRHVSILKYLKPKKIYYRCVDNLKEFPDVPKSLIDIEKELIKMADAVFFTSLKLLNEFKYLNKRSIYLPNGCSIELLKSNKINQSFLCDIFKTDKINILYVGTIGDWIDFDQIEYLSDKREFNIIFIGPIRTRIPEHLKEKSNIKFVGPVEYYFLGDIYKRANIGLIPFKVNDLTNAINPVKLYEYCLFGIPVVCPDLNGIKDINIPIFTYGRNNPIINTIYKAYEASLNYNFKIKLISFAENNTWQKRYNEIRHIILEE